VANCINRTDLKEMLMGRLEFKDVDGNQRGKPRFESHKVTDRETLDLVKDLDISAIESVPVESTKIANSLQVIINSIKAKSTEQSRKDFTDYVSRINDNSRDTAIVISEVIASLKNESDKALKNGLSDQNSLKNKDGLPYIPLNRLAAMIGRSIAISKGYYIGHKSGESTTSTNIEYLHYLIGYEALMDVSVEKMNGEQMFTVHEGKDSNPVIQDWLDNADAKPVYGRTAITDGSSGITTLDFNIKFFDKAFSRNGDQTLAQMLRGESVSPQSSKKQVVLNTVLGMTQLMTKVSLPQNIVLPHSEPNKSEHVKDDYKLDPDMVKVRDWMESNALYLDEGVNDLFRMLNAEVKKTGIEATQLIRDMFSSDKEAFKDLFGIELGNFIASDKESRMGRDLSKSVPINDLAEYFDNLGEGLTPEALYLSYFAGRNGRMYVEQTVINPHSSKAMRNAMVTEENTFNGANKKQKKVIDFFITKIGQKLVSDDELAGFIDAMMGKDADFKETMDKALSALDQFEKADKLDKKIKALKNMRVFTASKEAKKLGVKNLGFSELLTSLRAIKDIRGYAATGKLTTKQTVSSDATASGAMLSLLQALGINPEGISTLLRQLGILKAKDGKGKILSDVYGILSANLKKYLGKDKLTDNEIDFLEGDLDPVFETETDDIIRRDEILKWVFEKLYKSNFRELSKGPTMTAVYDQSISGANNSLSTEFTEKLIKHLGTNRKDAANYREFLELLLERELPDFNKDTIAYDSELKTEILDAFKQSQVPEKLYSMIQESVTGKYLSEYKAQAKKIFELIKTIPKSHDIRVLTMSDVLHRIGKGEDMDNIDPATLRGKLYPKYDPEDGEKPVSMGVRLTKKFDMINKGNLTDTFLTRKEVLRQTIINVSMVHVVDTGLLHRALLKIAKSGDMDSGVIAVHDELRGRPDLIMAFEEEYVRLTKQAAMDYDIHEQVLLGAAAFHPSLVNNPTYQELMTEIKYQKQAKRKILKEEFNEDTDSIVGDGKAGDITNIFLEWDEQEKQANHKTAVEFLESLRSESEIISEFLDNPTNTGALAEISESERSRFDNSRDVVVINQDDITVRQVEYGIVQSFTAALTEEWQKYNVRNMELDYIRKSMKTFEEMRNNAQLKGSLSDAALYRLDYALHGGDSAVSEFIAIMYTEPDVAAYVYSNLDKRGNNSNSTLKTVIERVMNKVRDFIRTVTKKDLKKNNVDVDLLHGAINKAIQDGKSFRKDNHESSTVTVDAEQSTSTNAPVSVEAEIKKELQAIKEEKNDTALEWLKSLKGQSEIIDDFLSNPAAASLEEADFSDISEGKGFSFDTEYDVVTIQKEGATLEKIEHEIVHSFTAGFIKQWQNGSVKSTELDYVNKSLEAFKKMWANNKMKGLASEDVKNRLEHFISSGNANIAEFVAIMSTEPKVAAYVYTNLNNGNTTVLKSVFDRLLKKVRDFIRSVSKSDMEKTDIDIDLLNGAVNKVLKDGKSFREDTYASHIEMMKGYDYPRLRFGPTREAAIPVDVDAISYVNATVARYINDPVLRMGKNGLVNANSILKSKFPMYSDFADNISGRATAIYNNSKELQSLVHKITNDGINNAKKNKVLSMANAIKTDSLEIVSRELKRIKQYTKKMDERELVRFNDFTMKMSMADYFAYGVDKETDIGDFLNRLENDANGLSKKEIAKLQTIVDLNTGKQPTKHTVYSIKEAGITADQDIQIKARQWVVAKTIQTLGVKEFEALKANTELMDVVRDLTLTNKAVIASEPALADMSVRDNGLVEEFAEPVNFRVISQSELNKYKNNPKSEWKVLREPKNHELGIIYKKTIDSTFQEGTYTTIQNLVGDISVDSKYSKLPGTVNTKAGPKLVLTAEEKQVLGVLKDPSQALVRSMVHNMEIAESMKIRDALSEQDVTKNLDKVGQEAIVAIIKDKAQDNPWFLSDTSEEGYSGLDDAIKSRYMPVPVKLSNVGNFGKNIRYVRKDIAYWLTGTSEASTVNGKNLQWAMRITKNLVAGTKIGMIVLNPMKIAMDNVSNVAYLGVMGVSPMFIQKQYRSILSEYNGYKGLRSSLNMLRIKEYGQPGKYAKQIASLEKQLKSHPAQGLVDRGFINSLGSELVMNTDDPSSGFKSDIDTVLKAIFLDKTGKNKPIADFIMKASKFGMNMEEVLELVARIPGKVDSGKELQSSLNVVANQLKDIKTDDDIINYVHQFINSPNSEFVKLGTHMTDLADVTAKETYYRYLVAKGIDPKKAELEVIDSFPDYKEGMPTGVKKLSDLGILMFPSYWLRIQKTIYRMVKNKPISFGTELAIHDMMGIDGVTIWDQNIVEKAGSFFGLIHTPWQHMGVNTVVPTNLF
jgi:hypothetical protein